MDENPTLEKIFRGAVKEFSQYGFDGARIDRIAKNAKINKAMIYYHFKGKEALYEHVLTMVVSGIYNAVFRLVPEEPTSQSDLAHLIRGYASYIGTIDELHVKIMLREISSGGKYFKKITIPILLEPMMKRVTAMFARGQQTGLITDIDPAYTMIQLVGSVVFFNMLKITMKDAGPFEELFTGNYIERYTENLIKIYSQGIFKNKR
ncbi:MAG TPA: TetR/AcrR family transcriptional regulator [Spirochaetota bacterium]|nr:TetR/AcrR family transcriptional regulator [Spirochaetota bacterium]HRZ28061.1 TetR/AcrR family transcriptional regulator [Spirochaetota bacterium]HSA13908.1 TetR/AcrR family transcriptional regulator [Spirochaetota bacterium]